MGELHHVAIPPRALLPLIRRAGHDMLPRTALPDFSGILPNKSESAWSVSRREERGLKNILSKPAYYPRRSLKEQTKYLKGISLIYVSIPFCKSKCRFCCFCKKFGPEISAVTKLKKAYLNALKKELAVKSLYFRREHIINLKAINFGGGTPSLLNPGELNEILSLILKFFEQGMENIIDVSIEASPDSLTPAKLRELKSAGFNRISIGAQTFNQRILEKLNRRHSVKLIYDSYDWARAAGFENINIDLLYGFFQQSFADFKKDLKITEALGPEHISVSPLLAVRTSPSGFIRKRKLKNTAKNIGWAQFAHRFLESKGYSNYFHKYFAKKGKESITELIYFYNIPYLGFGAGATSFLGENRPDITSYIAAPHLSGIFTTDALGALNTALEAIFDFLLFPEGISLPYFRERFNLDLARLLKDPQKELGQYKKLNKLEAESDKPTQLWRQKMVKRLQEWKDRGILEKQGDYLRIAPRLRFSKETWGLYMSSI